MPALIGPANMSTADDYRILQGSATTANATGGITISPPSRAVRVAVAGTLVVTYASGFIDTISMAAGETQNLMLKSIDAVSTATGITVFW